MTYEQLDSIADAYTPLLFLICGVQAFFSYTWDKNHIAAVHLSLGILTAYLVMLADNLTGIWFSLGLDYSTHSAVALALVFYLSMQWGRSTYRLCWLVSSLVAYYALEIYQQYHSVLDILTTVAVLLPLFTVIYLSIRQRTPPDTE